MSDTVRFGNLTIEISQTESETFYRFIGDVDEHFRQQDVPRVKKAKTTFTLDGINNFNSCGIREWIFLIKEIEQYSELVFKKCSVTMIDQINMVPDSLGNGTIESFYAPYYCENNDCGGEVSRLIVISEMTEKLINKTAPEFNCEKCGKPLTFDALEESYFLFADEALPRAS